jgi:signal transduction histidine kinase
MVVTLRMWQLHVREVEQRAEEAERTRDEAAQRRAMEERLRIARELHDSLTHSISVIQVQAGVAVHLARKRGEDVPPALLAIQEAGADAVRELRATLGVLRSEEDGDGSGLSQLDSLVARARAVGLPVTVTVTGAQRTLPPEVDQAAYRIVQEALTNVSRHAGDACASVRLHYTPEALSIQVDNDGNDTSSSTSTSTSTSTSVSAGVGARSSGPGLGLVGMRERVSALGGRLHAGPQDDGGFRVRAELPARAPS